MYLKPYDIYNFGAGINVLYLNVIRELNGWAEGVLEERRHLVKAEVQQQHQKEEQQQRNQDVQEYMPVRYLT